MDNYFDIVYCGKPIEPLPEYTLDVKHVVLGGAVLAVVALIYMIWVTYALMAILGLKMAGGSLANYIACLIIVFAIPYATGARVVKYFESD